MSSEKDIDSKYPPNSVHSNELSKAMGVPVKSGRDGKNRLYDRHLKKCKADWEAVARLLESDPDAKNALIRKGADDAYSPLTVALNNESRPVPGNVVDALLEKWRVMPYIIEVARTNKATKAEVWRILLRTAVQRDCDHVEGLEKDVQKIAFRYLSESSFDSLRAMVETVPENLAPSCGSRTLIESALARCSDSANIIRFVLEEGMKHNVGGQFGAGGLLIERDDPFQSKSRPFCWDSDEEDNDEPHRKMSVLDIHIEEIRRKNRSACSIVECCRAIECTRAKESGTDESPAILVAMERVPLSVTMDLLTTRSNDHRDYCTTIDQMGRNCMHIAMKKFGEVPLVERDKEQMRKFIRDFLLRPRNGSLARSRDGNGRLPLHEACDNGLSLDFGLDLVLDAHPQAAACTDSSGQLPLHVAVSKGHPWQIKDLEALMHACPQAVTCRNEKTGMHPFMIEASSPMPSIDVVYMLLREDPMQVCGGIRQSAQEVYLYEKLEEQRAANIKLRKVIADLKRENEGLKRGGSNRSGKRARCD